MATGARGGPERSSRRGWLVMLAIWAVLVVLFFVLAGSRAGFATLAGGALGALIALVTVRLGRRGRSGRPPA